MVKKLVEDFIRMIRETSPYFMAYINKLMFIQNRSVQIFIWKERL